MKLEEIRQLTPEQLKQVLADKNISIRDIAIQLDISHPVVSDVINQKYKGAEEMKNRVYEQITKMLEGREDLNGIVYDNFDTVDKLVHLGINSAKFSIPEKEFLISLHKKLNNYKVNQHA